MINPNSGHMSHIKVDNTRMSAMLGENVNTGSVIGITEIRQTEIEKLMQIDVNAYVETQYSTDPIV